MTSLKKYAIVLPAPLAARDVVELDHLIKDREVSGLLQVSVHPDYQPQRIIVESTSYAVIASFRKRLVLVVAAPVRELGGSNVKYPLAGSLRNHMDYSKKVLVGIPEAHPTAYSAFEEARAAAEQESDHALVLVPDVDHTVKFRHTRVQIEIAEQAVPVAAQSFKCRIYLHRIGECPNDPERLLLVDHSWSDELFLLRILGISEHEYQVPALTRFQ